MQSFSEILAMLANIASIATALVAVWAYWRYTSNLRSAKARLEARLAEARTDENRMSVPVIEAAAELGMSESDVLSAAYRSKHIKLLVTPNMVGTPQRIVLEYTGPLTR